MYHLRKELSLGVASASMQIEGGNIDSNWHDWYAQGKIKDGSNPANANDHYHRYQEDFQIMAQLGIKEYRFGVEWTRIEPREGEFDQEALHHYKEMITSMKSLGIRPLLTLFHFSYPMWFERKGGFLKFENNQYFLRYVSQCLEAFGDLVDEYITINEPNVWAVQSYLFGEWPHTGPTGLKPTLTCMSVLATAHIHAYQLIKDFKPEAKVSFAHHVRVFKPKAKKDTPMTKLMAYAFQEIISHAFFKGDFKFPLINKEGIKKGEYIDFIAVNYYTQTVVSGTDFGFSAHLPKNDLEWDIYPEGLSRLSRELYSILPRPIYITENGTCDNDDRFRSRYLYEHLTEINKIGLPLERYYYWSFSDNFEWIEGESSRFGLVHIDYETQERTIKKSGYFYRDIIKHHGFTTDMVEEYLKDSHYDWV